MAIRFRTGKYSIGLPASKILVALAIALLGAGQACKSVPPDKQPPPKADAGIQRRLGDFQAVQGTSYLMAPIASQFEERWSEGYRSSVYNYAFFNSADQSMHTLLPSNDYLITWSRSFPESKGRNGEDPKAE